MEGVWLRSGGCRIGGVEEKAVIVVGRGGKVGGAEDAMCVKLVFGESF